MMNKALKKIIDSFNVLLTVFGFTLKIGRVNKDKVLLTNVFERENASGKVLISYLIDSFLQKELPKNHTNYTECYTAGKIFDELGYQVDVINYSQSGSIVSFDDYEIVYGMGDPLEESFYSINSERIKKIFYATGCNPHFSNTASALRVLDFFNKHKVLIPSSSRVSGKTWKFSTILSDGIITLGNDFVKKTFTVENPGIECHPVDIFFFEGNKIDLDKKTFSEAKKHFTWFGSGGKIHKGLDITLDIFLRRDDLVLHVCCDTNGEKEFWDYYLPKIALATNIILHGFVDVRSEEFNTVLYTCAATIFPSISEGGSPSVIALAASGGLFPIISKNCGLDLEEFGIMVNEVSEKTFEEAINNFLQMEDSYLKENARLLMRASSHRYTYENYYENLKSSIEKILS